MAALPMQGTAPTLKPYPHAGALMDVEKRIKARLPEVLEAADMDTLTERAIRNALAAELGVDISPHKTLIKVRGRPCKQPPLHTHACILHGRPPHLAS